MEETSRPDRRDAERPALRVRRIGQSILRRERGPRLVLAPRVDDRERMRGRLDVREVELRDLPHCFENRTELVAHAVDLALGNLEPREARYMQYVFSRDRHTTSEASNLKRDGPRSRGPVSGLLELRAR